VRDRYKEFPQHVKYFQIIFLCLQLYDRGPETHSGDAGRQ